MLHVAEERCLFPLQQRIANLPVIGIDISEGMIEQARNEVSLQGLANTKVFKMDAENLDFPDSSFDFVLCGLCLFFFPNLDQALTGFLRVLKPGGRLAASTFQAVEDARTKRWDKLDDAFKDCLKPVPTVQTKKLDSEAEIRQALSQAGFSEIEVMLQEEIFYFSEDEWWQTAWSMAIEASWSAWNRMLSIKTSDTTISRGEDRARDS